MKKRIIVIGSGFGGLSAAVRLAARGHQVTLFEKRDKLGGRAYQYEVNGFKFDGGPTVITAPYMFDEVFSAAGRNRSDYLSFTPLDPFYRIFDQSGEYFDYHRDFDAMIEEVKRWNPADVSGFAALAKQTHRIFDAFHPYTDQPFLTLGSMLKIMPDVIRLSAYLGTHDLIARYVKHPFLQKVFSFHPLLIGGNPFDTPAIYTLIMQFEKQWGVHYAQGGTGAIVRAFGELLCELGVEVQYNTEITEILIRDSRAVGVRLADGREVSADEIVCNGDVAYAYRYLIPKNQRKFYPNWRLEAMKYSMSLFVIYFGTKRRYPDAPLRHHNILVNQNYRKLLREIFAGQKLPDEFALYLHMPTRTDESIAPKDCESFYVLSPVPTLSERVDWNVTAGMYRDRIMQFLEDNYLPELQDNIVAEHYIDPLHFEKTLNSYRGAAFSVLPSLLQSAWLRPHNQAEGIGNLYFVGAGTHPGAGVPAVISSGKIAAGLIDPTTRESYPGQVNGRSVSISGRETKVSQ